MCNNPYQLKFPATQRAKLIAVLLCLMGVGCGGGGGSAPPSMDPMPPVIPPTTTTPPVNIPPPTTPLTIPPDPADFEMRRQIFRDAEFLQGASNPLSAVKADYAYARGYTGEGVTVGIIDSGIFRHNEFIDQPNGINQLHPDTTDEAGYTPTRLPVVGGSIIDGSQAHGTWTSGIIAASRSPLTPITGQNMHGIAFGAQVLMYGVDLSGGSGNYQPVDITTVNAGIRDFDQQETDRANFMISRNIKIVNKSYGIGGDISLYNEADIRRAIPKYIEAVAQSGVAAADRTIFVRAAGNAYTAIESSGNRALADNPEILPGLPVHIAELRGHYLAVVAVDTTDADPNNHRIATFSNRCGIASDYCLAAPGVNISGPDVTNGLSYQDRSGTSASAPLVSGALALLTQAFRAQIGNDELVTRLLRTANKTGVYADETIYGQGMLDLDAATKPQGTPMLPVSNTLSGPSVAAQISSLKLGMAFGDALSNGLRSVEIATFDDLKAPFFTSLDTFVRPTPNTQFEFTEQAWTLGNDPRGTVLSIGNNAQVSVQLADDLHGSHLTALSFSQELTAGGRVFASLRSHPGWHFGLHQSEVLTPGQFSDPDAFALPYLALARNGGIAGFNTDLGNGSLQFAAFHGKAQWGERRNSTADDAWGTVLEYRPSTSTVDSTILSGLRLQFGALQEAHSSLGAGASGAFGDFGSHTVFSGVTGHWPLKHDWVGFVSAHAGMTHPQSQRHLSLIKSVSTLWSSAMGAGLVRQNLLHKGDRLSLRLSQPLRIESGHTTLGWATGRTREGELLQEQRDFSLSPSGRQWDAEINYAHHFSDSSIINLAMVATRDQGHVAEAGMRYSLLLRYGF